MGKCMCYCVLDLMLNISLAELFKGNHVISNELKCNLDGSYSIKYFGYRGLGLFPNSSSSSSKVLSIVIFWIQNDQSEYTIWSPWWCSHELKLIRAQVLPPCDLIYTVLFLMITLREKIHVLNCMSCSVMFSWGFYKPTSMQYLWRKSGWYE